MIMISLHKYNSIFWF